MIQEFIYKKDITREINGVIKADSTSALSEEITEYVITAEQLRLLPRLFDTLVPPHKANCVWISGDFGSGKSHLLIEGGTSVISLDGNCRRNRKGKRDDNCNKRKHNIKKSFYIFVHKNSPHQ